MRVLVTGAAGFVGRHLCETLARQGSSVTAAVRHRPADVPGADRLVAVGEIDGATDWRVALRDADAVVHLAALAHRGEATTQAAEAAFHRINVEGSQRLAAQALEAGVRRFVYLSSAKVWGEASGTSPFTRESPTAPAGPYGRSKLAAEEALRARCEAAGVPLAVFRPPLVYGPGQKANLLALMRAVAWHLPLPLGAIGNQRSLVHVGHLVAAIALELQRGLAGSRVYPISDIDVSTPALVRALAAGMGRRPWLPPVPVGWLRGLAGLLGKEAAVARLTDSFLVGRAEVSRELGWQPVLSFEEAMRLTGRWYLGR